jgi:site-specific DNA recombinase
MRLAALYARVSSQQQKDDKTIDSQIKEVLQYFQNREFSVPTEWIFKDEGISGATLQRPALEQLRDLSAQGKIEIVLCYSPDRLSRKYAYQVLLVEEFKNYGTEVLFLHSPKGQTPEDNLLIQFQGMIAEYERALITERCRRGRKHSARNGNISAIGKAPYGYRYIKKNGNIPAAYQINEYEAEVVRKIFRKYTEEGFSMGEIVNWLSSNNIPTQQGKNRWGRQVIRAILRNPAYTGKAAYGKTESTPKNSSVLNRRKNASAKPARKDKDKQSWIDISVPVLISEETYYIAQETLQRNKQLSARSTKEHSLLQGLLKCADCGYSYYKTSTTTAKSKCTYYRCLGRDKGRTAREHCCENRTRKQEHLDDLVWNHIASLLQNPVLIKNEIDRRLAEARQENGETVQHESLRLEIIRLENGMNSLLDALQGGLVTVEELGIRMPALRQKRQSLLAQLKKLEAEKMQEDEVKKITDSIETFLQQLNKSLTDLNLMEKKRIIQIFVKEIIVGKETITINHMIPLRGIQGNEPNLLLCQDLVVGGSL